MTDFCLQFDKDEVQGLFNIGTESWAVLIWSYKCIPGAKYIGRPPDHFNAIDLPVQNSTNLTHVESNSEDDGDQHDGEANDAGDELYTTTFAIKGSTYNDIYQENCAKCFATKKTNDNTIRKGTRQSKRFQCHCCKSMCGRSIFVKVCVDDLSL
jgi:hypothetical protein